MKTIDNVSIAKRLTDARSPLKMDPIFNGGYLSVPMDARLTTPFSEWTKMKAALIGIDEAKIEFDERIEQFSLQAPKIKNFCLVMLSYPSEEFSTGQIMSALENTGLRPASLEEVITGALAFPKWFKPSGPIGRMVALGSPLQLGTDFFQRQYGEDLPEFKDPINLLVPYIGWLMDTRFLRVTPWHCLWNKYDRFVCTLSD